MSQVRTVEIPIGPQHPALHEPLQLKLKVDGEVVVDVFLVPGFNHRGVEWLAERRSFIHCLYMCSRVCGICNTIHGTTYALAVEDLAKIEVPPRAKWLRVLVNELERIHSHMIILAIIAELIGFDTLFMLLMRDRERVMYLKELVTGNRVLADYIAIGGVKRDINQEKADIIKKHLNYIEERMKYYKKVFAEDPIVRRRLVDVGKIPYSRAIDLCLVGPTARGSGISCDIRKLDPYDAYDEVPFNEIVYKECDSWARVMVRVDETLESINMVRYVLDHLPSGPIGPKVIPRRFPAGEGIGRSEAPRGELLYHIIHDGKGMNPYRLKIRTPSFTNIHNGIKILVGQHIADVPAIFGSYDPCISCSERVTVVDVKTERTYTMRLKDLSKMKR